MTDDPDVDELDEGPLRWVRVSIPWQVFDLVDDGRRLRLFYTYPLDEGVLADVVIGESRDVVLVTLFRRALIGVYPDGSWTGESLLPCAGCVQVALEEPLGQRRLIDGSTGEVPRPRVQSPAEDEVDWGYARELERGCPLWVP